MSIPPARHQSPKTNFRPLSAFQFTLVVAVVAAALVGSKSSNGLGFAPEHGQSPVPLSKFAHSDGKVLVFAGQNLADTRDYYADGRFPKPVGFSDYISYDVGASYADYAPDYPATYQGNDGLRVAANWGSGEQCVGCLLSEPGFEGAMINIGMYLAGPNQADGSPCTGKSSCHLHSISEGKMDYLLADFAKWLKEHKEHPVLLRIGYEFDGSWNGYDPQQFVAAYKHIYHFLNDRGVDNVAYVFHSFGYASRETLEQYFPEPDERAERYVDWIGYSYFAMANDRVGIEELKFAREKGLKVFLGEVAPHGGDCQQQINIAKDTAPAIQWIENFDTHVHDNSDVIGAIAYINARWNDREYSPQWGAAPDQNCDGFFAHSNSRLTDNKAVAEFWSNIISKPLYQHGTDALSKQLVAQEVSVGEL